MRGSYWCLLDGHKWPLGMLFISVAPVVTLHHSTSIEVRYKVWLTDRDNLVITEYLFPMYFCDNKIVYL